MSFNFTLVDILGYLGCILIFSAFYMKAMIPLRVAAICSNCVMITYTALGGIYPVLVLHLALLPLNITMLFQMKKLIRNVREAYEGEGSMDWLMPYMKKEVYKTGEFVFKVREKAEYLFLLKEGKILLPEFGKEMNPGELIGEIGIFSPGRERTASAQCIDDVVLYSIPYDKVLQLYYQNPKFGFVLIQLINKRLLEDEDRRSQLLSESAMSLT